MSLFFVRAWMPVLLLSLLISCSGSAEPQKQATAAPGRTPVLAEQSESAGPPEKKLPDHHWTSVRSDVREKILRQREKFSARQKKEMEKLESLGYLSGYQKKPQQQNVTIYRKDRAYSGLNLYVSGHGPEAILMDMTGNVLHSWRYPLHRAVSNSDRSHFWRRAHLFPNGDLLALYEANPLIKLDKDSNLIWVYDSVAHHDLQVTPDGLIYVLTHNAVINPKYRKNEAFLDDYICVLGPDGKERKCVSVLKSLETSAYAPILHNVNWENYDPFHTNTVEVLDGRLAESSPALRRGNVMISLCHIDLVCVVDMDQEKVVWALTGLWHAQHEPTILDNGNMLIFDNLGYKTQRSKVMELNPFSQEIVWQYEGSEQNPFFCPAIGSSARLPNGNTLITESTTGRAFEVTADKQVVWEFISPHHPEGKEHIIGTLFDVVRIPPTFSLDWLEKKKKDES